MKFIERPVEKQKKRAQRTHVDHIRPLQVGFHPDNLQIITAEENLSKVLLQG